MTELSHMSSEKPHTQAFNDEYALQLQEQLKEAELQREKLQSENINDISVCMADKNLVEKISDEMMKNVEDEWDVGNSIAEIKQLEDENKENILMLANELEDLIE